MRNEEAVTYSADNGAAATTTTGSMLADAKIKLVGHEVPSLQIRNRTQLETYCTELLGDSAVEEFHVICLNAQCEVITEALVSRGDISQVSAYPRNIATIALLSNAHSVFLTHNHPGGTCRPSPEDIQSTYQIRDALKIFGITVLDHMIVAHGRGCYSMTQMGDLSYR